MIRQARSRRPSAGRQDVKPSVWRAMLTVWVVVNLVDLLQAAGFAARAAGPGGMGANHALGVVIAALALPATWALVVLLRERAGPWLCLGPLVFDAFVILMLAVDYAFAVEFRDPPRAVVLVPYLGLFFGSIVLMGAPMYRVSRHRWLITAATSALLIAAMVLALTRGAG